MAESTNSLKQLQELQAKVDAAKVTRARAEANAAAANAAAENLEKELSSDFKVGFDKSRSLLDQIDAKLEQLIGEAKKKLDSL